MTTNLNKMAGALGKNLKDMATGAVDALEGFLAFISGEGPSVENAFLSGLLQPIQQAFTTIQHIAGKWATNVIPVIMDALWKIPLLIQRIFIALGPIVFEALANVGGFIVKALNFAFEVIPGLVTKALSFIFTIGGGILSAIQMLLPEVLTMLMTGLGTIANLAVDGATAVLESIYGEWSMGGEGGWWASFTENILGGFVYMFNDVIMFISAQTPKLLFAILRWAEEMWPKITNMMNLGLRIAFNVLWSGVFYIAEIVGAMGEAMMGMGTALYAWILIAAPKAWNAISEYISSLITAIQEGSGYYLARMAEWGTGLWNWIITAIPMVLNAAFTFATGLMNFLAENLPKWLTTLGEWAGALIGWIGAAIPPALTAIGQFLGDLIVWIIGKLPEWIGALANLAGALWNWIVDAFPKAMEALGSFIGGLIGWLVAEAIPGLISWGITAAGALLGWIWEVVIPAIPGALWDFATGLINGLGAIIVGILKAAWAIGAGIVEAVWKAMSGKTAEEAVPNADASGQLIVGGVTTGITTAMPEALAAAGSITSETAAAILGGRQEAVNAAMSVGTDITTGVSSGINANKDAVVNAARGMASAAVQAAKTEIHAMSPSRVFRDQIGAMIPLGMAIGIESETGAVVKAAVGMVRAVQDATNQAMRRGGVSQIEVIGRPGALSASVQAGYGAMRSSMGGGTTVIRNQSITYAPTYTTTPSPTVDLTLARSLSGVNS
jgi:hypothetical protein